VVTIGKFDSALNFVFIDIDGLVDIGRSEAPAQRRAEQQVRPLMFLWHL
jgi:hypothetical protein